jgi:acetyl esterase/lipase
MITAAYFFSMLVLILNLSLFIRLKPPFNFFIVFLQLAAGALSPFLAVLGLLGAGLGWLSHAPLAFAAGLLGAGISAAYIVLVTRTQKGFEVAFGKDWQARLPPTSTARMLKRRWNLGWPRTGEPRWERDIPFWMIPFTERKLSCDLWQPPEGATRSGVAVIYFHGSGWWAFDKDFGTRSFFRQLAAQGHVIMDVAYRLCPEVDIYEMAGDVRRAIAWMKASAEKYAVDPGRIILAGASAGGHLSLLTAYAPDHPRFTPADVQGMDASVRAVVSYYGPADLRACYEHTSQSRLKSLPKVETGLPAAASMKKGMTNIGRLDTLLGGHLDEVPEIYALASPVTYVHAGCPPTLLIQGQDDLITPASATRALQHRLEENGVPSVNIIYPMTNHAFDLVLPKVNPAAGAALYDLERFLALVA